jgi:hypothetical protein
MSLIFEWIRQLPSILNDFTYVPRPVIGVDNMGNSYVAYVTIEPSVTDQGQSNVGRIDICVVKFDSDGGIVWYRQQPSFDTTIDDTEPAISVDPSGNVYIAYSTGGVTSGQPPTPTTLTDIVVFKLNSNGDTVWVRQNSDFNTAGQDTAPSISTDSVGNVYVAYYATDPTFPPTNYDFIVLFKLDTDGNFLWVKNNIFNTLGGNYFPSIDVDQSGNCYVAYFCDGSPASGESTVGLFDIIIFKTDTNGNVIWIRQRPSFNTSNYDYQPSLVVADNGTSYIAYHTLGGTVSGQTNTGGNDIVVFKLDSDGNSVWTKQNPSFNTIDSDSFASIGIDTLGYIYVTYSTSGVISGQTLTGTTDIVVFQLDKDGNTITTIQQPSMNTPDNNLYPSIAIDPQGNCLVAYYSQSIDQSLQNLVVFKLRNLICVAGSTQILMMDGSTKPISQITRGEMVAPNHQVARLCRERVDYSSTIDLMIFEPKCLGNRPTQQLIVTPNHPIFYQGARRPAKCFSKCPGVTNYKDQPVSCVAHLLGDQEDLYLYDLQFEHEGSYLANGLEVQSRSPCSYYGPLPKELYFDQSLYCDDHVWDSLDHLLPLDTTILEFNVIMLKNKHHKNTIESTDNHTVVITKWCER